MLKPSPLTLPEQRASAARAHVAQPFTPSLRMSVKRPPGRAASGPTGTVGADPPEVKAHGKGSLREYLRKSPVRAGSLFRSEF